MEGGGNSKNRKFRHIQVSPTFDCNRTVKHTHTHTHTHTQTVIRERFPMGEKTKNIIKILS